MLILNDKEKRLLNQRSKGALSFTDEEAHLRTWGGEIFAFLNHQRLDDLNLIPANSSIKRTFEFYLDEKDQITIEIKRRVNYRGEVEQKNKKIVFPSKLKDVLFKVLEDHIDSEKKAYIKAQYARSARINESDIANCENLLSYIDRSERGIKQGITALRQKATDLLESVDADGFYSSKLRKVSPCHNALRSFKYRERFEGIGNKINRLFDDNAGLCCSKINHYRFIEQSFTSMF